MRAPSDNVLLGQLSVVSAGFSALAAYLTLSGTLSKSLLQASHGISVGAFAAGHDGHQLVHRTVYWHELDAKLVCHNKEVAEQWAKPLGLCSAKGEWLGPPAEIKAIEALGLIGGALLAVAAVASLLLAKELGLPLGACATLKRALGWAPLAPGEPAAGYQRSPADSPAVLGFSIAGGALAIVSALLLIADYAVWAATPLPASLIDKKGVVPLWSSLLGKHHLELSDPLQFTLATSAFQGLVVASVLAILSGVILLGVAVKTSGGRAPLADADEASIEAGLLKNAADPAAPVTSEGGRVTFQVLVQ